MNDLEKRLSENGCEQLNYNDAQIANFLKITFLLYADDIIVLADSVKGLPKTLNSLNQYCKEWKLLVNEKKTKVVIYSRRKYSGIVIFTLNNNVLHIVDDFKYLGDTFSRTGKF